MEYSLINLEKNEFSLSSSLAGVSYSAILPAHQKQKFKISDIDAQNQDAKTLEVKSLPSLRTKTRSLCITVWIL